MPQGVLLGASVVIGDRVYTRLIHYSGLEDQNRQIDVCMEVWHDGKPGAPYFGVDPENPGHILVAPRIQLKAVSHWP